ncbi:GNAT family N-acetyltransferase [Marinomonas sp. CT5]|uniref:GNAT family N-acetyltransferase n=1 Tax=Marinomonas sp. CT5 TaxID=2066133 RepID=UPI0020162512|nr:GNAT family N-acetyltransferase [Marinomonas sp. CT5]
MAYSLGLGDQQVSLRLLSRSDYASLLRFEVENRAWFESHINPREAEFYAVDGVKNHIEECLSQYQRKVMLPMLITHETGEIIGRINLTNINSVLSEAYLGYRMSEKFTGRGIAKRAVEQMIQLAKELNLHTLMAFASIGNRASQTVLARNGFVEMKTHENFAEVLGCSVDCIEYLKTIE